MPEPREYERVIKEITENCGVTTFEAGGGSTYTYCILPIESRMPPEYLNAVTYGMIEMLDYELGSATCLVVPEAKAFLIGTMIGKEAGLPVVPLKKNRDYKKPEQVIIPLKGKAYKGGEGDFFYATGFRKGDKPLIVDDIISSGWTDISVTESLINHGYRPVGVSSLYERGDGIENIKRVTDYHAKGLARLEIVDGRPFIPRFWDTPSPVFVWDPK